jgi:hypothetical protein
LRNGKEEINKVGYVMIDDKLYGRLKPKKLLCNGKVCCTCGEQLYKNKSFDTMKYCYMCGQAIERRAPNIFEEDM